MSPVKRTETPLPHQREAVKAILSQFKKGLPRMFTRQSARTQLIMACGTGKTYTAMLVAQEGYKKIVVFVPSLALVRQILNEWRSRWTKWTSLAVCSDPSVADDTTYVSPDEVGCEVTSDAKVAASFMKDEGIRVVFCTYHSSHLLDGLEFDLGIFDEAHRTAGVKSKAFAFALSDENVTITRRLFMTATPRHSDAESKSLVFSMGDESVYGPVAYRLSFRDAIDRDLICDYKIAVYPLRENVRTDSKRAMQVALQKTMRKYGVKRAFTFHSRVDRASDFATDNEVMKSTNRWHICGTMPTAKRDTVLDKMKKFGGVVTNVRCLAEGVNVPTVDMVGFVDPKKSPIDIAQAAGRALRKSESSGKKLGIIFVPVFIKALPQKVCTGPTSGAAASTFGAIVLNTGSSPRKNVASTTHRKL